jgi:hypothetical protein
VKDKTVVVGHYKGEDVTVTEGSVFNQAMDKVHEIYTKHHEGVKNDNGKLRVDLIPPEALESLGAVLRHGATKYEDRNWEKGIQYNRIYAALLRHLITWAKGEKIDAESGFNHLDHAFCNLMFLVTYERRGMVSFDNLTHNNSHRDIDTLDTITDSGHSLSCV